MGGLNLTYTHRDINASAAMRRLADRFSDLSPLMDELGAEIEDQTVERFQTNIAPDGSPWLPSLRVQRAQGAALTLVDRGHLRDSITRISGRHQTQVGTNVIYAAIHQWGGKVGRNGATVLDARPYLGISPANDNALTEIAMDYHRAAFGGKL